MQIQYLEPITGVHRVSIDGRIFLRMYDFTTDFDTRFGRRGVGSALCRLFRNAHPDTFFFSEINPLRKRGYYMEEALLDKFVAFTGENREAAIQLLESEKGRKPKSVKSAKRRNLVVKDLPKINANRMMSEERLVVQDSFEGQEITHFSENGVTWVRINDVVRILRPDTQLPSHTASLARRAGLVLRSIRVPKVQGRGSYYAQLKDFNTLCKLCYFNHRKLAARQLKAFLDGLSQSRTETAVETPEVVTQPISAGSEVEELRAMNAKLLDAMNNMMALVLRQGDGPVKVGA